MKKTEHLRHRDKTLCSLSSGQHHQPSVAPSSLKIVNRLWHIDYLTAAEWRKKHLFQLSPRFLYTLFSLRPQNNTELASTFFSCHARSPRVSVVQTRTRHQLNEWRNHAEQSVRWNDSHEWTKCRATIPKWHFFFLQLVGVVIFWHYDLKNSAGYDYLSWEERRCWF